MSGTLGQVDAGFITGRGLTVQSGFWVFLLPAEVPDSPGPIADLALSLQKKADPVLVNADLIFTLVVTNRGPATATNLVVTYPLPAGLTLVSGASLRPLTVNGSLLTCAVGTLNPGQSVEIELVLRSATPGLFLNSAALAASQSDPTPLDHATTVASTVASGPPRFFSWNNGASGDFLNPLNWTPNDGPPSFGDTASISSGSASLNGIAIIGTLNLSGGELTGTGSFTVGLGLNWSGGTMSGAGVTIIPPSVSLNLSGTAQKTLQSRTLNNGGTATWTGSGTLVNVGVATLLNNQAGALFDIQTDAALSSFGGYAVLLNNAGTLRKTAGTGGQNFQANLTNTGTVEINSGSMAWVAGGSLNNHGLLRVAGGGNATFRVSGTNSGTFEAVSPSYTYFEQGTHALGNGARLIGSGFHYVGSLAIANVTGEVGAERLALQTGGTLGGAGTLTVTNTFNWTGGTMNGNGVTTLVPGSALNLSGTAQKTLHLRTLNNGGTLTWTGTGEIQAYATLNNLAGALFDIQTDAAFNRLSGLALTFNNAGTVRKSATTGTSSFQVNLANTGTLDVSSGILSLNGTYAPTASARTRFAIGGAAAGTGYGRLVASGALTLAGQLELVLTNGFVPANGAVFAVLSGASRTGTFTTTTGRGAGGGLFFKPTYITTGMNLVVADGAPRFDAGLPSLVNGQFQMRYSGATGENYRVDVSTNLTTWAILSTTAMPPAGFLDFADAGAGSSPHRFYRVVFLP